ncbi:unnamed protein product [Cercopithifilaria johnstoni]|uniref:Uncharacterized protein n=1 Tax=Cercopithifilaria johnstoni TaxID=2874296 RepID=A0A8J2MBC4_9BILA|nr:unnamed protein product [Cercopithifilaria johnstoni]
MHIGDLKRAVEDVVLRPDDNPLSDMEERSTIAALDLCQLGQAQGTLLRTSTSNQIQRQRTATAPTSTSYSGDMLASSAESTCSTSVTTSSGHVLGAPPLSMSTSLDTMVLRQTLSSRPSLGTSRRSSRVLPHYSQNKRKRSNSVSSCLNKSFLIHHGVASTTGVSATTTGGASALSLPPTARHTPFRFGDFDERSSSTRSASGDNPSPIPYTTGLIEPMLGIRMQQQQHQPLQSEEWTKICEERRNDPRQQQTSKFEDFTDRNLQTTNNCMPKLFPVSSFTAFCEAHKAYDSDNEEQMECD